MEAVIEPPNSTSDGKLRSMENLRKNPADVLDTSGPKLERHKSIMELRNPNRYVAPTCEEILAQLNRKRYEISNLGHPRFVGSVESMIVLRPIEENQPYMDFDHIYRKIKSQTVSWDSAFNIHYADKFFTSELWSVWTKDVLETFSTTLKNANIYGAIYVSQFKYERNSDLFKALLERWSHNTNTFHSVYGELGFSLWDLHRISGLPILGHFYDEYVPFNKSLYSKKISKVCRSLFEIHATSPTKKLVAWARRFLNPKNGYSRVTSVNPDVYLAGYLSCWLSGFVLPYATNEIRPTTYVIASRMTSGERFNLAVPVLARLYRCFNIISKSDSPGKKDIYGPFQYLFGWISYYFPKMYTRRDPRILTSEFEFKHPFMPYLGNIGNQIAAPAHNNIEKLFSNSDEFQFRAFDKSDEPSGLLSDTQEINGYLRAFLISMRCGVLTLRFGDILTSEPYQPSRFSRQFGFFQACPKALDISVSNSLKPDDFYYEWCALMRKNTQVTFELPWKCNSVTENYAKWWIASSFAAIAYVHPSNIPRKRVFTKDPETKNSKKSRKSKDLHQSEYSSRPVISDPTRSRGSWSKLTSHTPNPKWVDQTSNINIENQNLIVEAVEKVSKDLPNMKGNRLEPQVKLPEANEILFSSVVEETREVSKSLSSVTLIDASLEPTPEDISNHVFLEQLVRPEPSIAETRDITGPLLMQKGLIYSLQTLPELNLEEIINISNCVFSALKHMKFDFSHLYEKVRDFTASAFRVHNFKLSSSIDTLSSECENRKRHFEEIFDRFTKVQSSKDKAEADVASQKRKISEVRDVLQKLEEELASIEETRTDLTEQYAHLSTDVLTAEEEFRKISQAFEEQKKIAENHDILKRDFQRAKEALNT